MNTPIPSSRENRHSNERNVRKVNKSCEPCRIRKIRCDAAIFGSPCASCKSRQCAEQCVLPTRKPRIRKTRDPTIASVRSESFPETSDSLPSQPNQSLPATSSYEGSPEVEPDLEYLNILKDTVKENSDSTRNSIASKHVRHSNIGDTVVPQHGLRTSLSHLDDLDRDYLVKKGVFDLPPKHYQDALVKAYFDHVYPFAPIIDRVDFIHKYQSGACSLFLLRVLLVPATLHVHADVLYACGFTSRSIAQESFFVKARLLYCFAAEDDPWMVLQGSIILCAVILDHPTNQDFSYWFHNAIRLATKLDLRNRCIHETEPDNRLRLYRRIWWTLYSSDIFHVFVNRGRSRLLGDDPAIKLRIEFDHEADNIAGAASHLLSPVTTQQKALPAAFGQLSRIFAQLLSSMTTKPQRDFQRMMQPLDVWRKMLGSNMRIADESETNVYYLSARTMSYRFECAFCRLVRYRYQHAQDTSWSDCAKRRLRSAVLELDTIAAKVLTSGTLQDFSISFITTMTALLALHIESALDPTETDLVRSMARISISQTMLLLNQGKEVPLLRRALPIFEEILTKKNLYLVPANHIDQSSECLQRQSRAKSVTGEHLREHSLDDQVSPQADELEQNLFSEMHFLGFDFLGESEWHSEQLDFTE